MRAATSGQLSLWPPPQAKRPTNWPQRLAVPRRRRAAAGAGRARRPRVGVTRYRTRTPPLVSDWRPRGPSDGRAAHLESDWRPSDSESSGTGLSLSITATVRPGPGGFQSQWPLRKERACHSPPSPAPGALSRRGRPGQGPGQALVRTVTVSDCHGVMSLGRRAALASRRSGPAATPGRARRHAESLASFPSPGSTQAEY